MKTTLTLLLILLSFSSFAEVQVYELKTAVDFQSNGFLGYQRGIFESTDNSTVRVTCREMAFYESDDVIIQEVEGNKVIGYVERNIEDIDDCYDDIKEIIQSLEEGKHVSLKVGLTGLTFKEID